MTTKDIILTIFEFLLFVSVFLGAIFEYKLIDFEIALKEKIKNFWRWSVKMYLLLILFLPILIILSAAK